MDLARARELANAALQNLERHKRRINALNVYPVPDGDTGTNLTATVRGIVSALDACDAETPREVAAALSKSALMEAKGNSGVIFSQIVRGLAEVIGEHEHVDARVLAQRSGPRPPVPTRVSSDPSRGRCSPSSGRWPRRRSGPRSRPCRSTCALAQVIAAGDEAVARTPEQLAILRESGVVDAGGAGLVEIFRGFHHGLTGEPLPELPVELDELTEEAIHHEASRYRYCTVFLVEGESLDPEGLRHRLEPLGDSLLVVGDQALVKVHVHTDDPEEALCGRPLGGAGRRGARRDRGHAQPGERA